MANYQPPPNPYGQPAQDPGRTMGIVGLILAIFCNLIGLVVSIIAFNRSKNAGFKNNIALAGIIVGAVLFVVGLIVNFTVYIPMMQNR
jgi:Ca2+/H+ antiporter